MRKLRCLIVDDEPIARRVIREFVEQSELLQCLGEFENALKADAFLKEQEVDILFLDIQMPGLTGIEFLKSCKVKPVVLITTAYPEHALEGYELDVIDYLLKPIAFSRFVKAVQKARDYIDRNHSMPASNFIFVRTDRKIEKLELNEILFAESIGNYVSIVTAGKTILAYLTMKNLEDQLPGNIFQKVHRSFIVNFSKIEAIENNHIRIGAKQIAIGKNFLESVQRIVNERLLKR